MGKKFQKTKEIRCSQASRNTVKIRGGPTAVTPPFFVAIKRELFWRLFATISNHRNGKAAKRAGKSEDLLMSIKKRD